MYDVEVLSPAPGFGDGVLVRRSDGQHFVVSTAVTSDTNKEETLAFECDESGKVTDWGGVYGGIGATREDTLAQIAEGGDRREEIAEQWAEEMGGTGPAALSVLDTLARLAKERGL